MKEVMEVRIEIIVTPSGIYQRISDTPNEWLPFAKVSPAVVMDKLKAAQQSVQRTGGESGQQSLFTAEHNLPAKVTRQTTRR